MSELITAKRDELTITDAQLPPILDGHYSPAVHKKVESFYLSVPKMREAWIKKNENLNTQRSYRAATDSLIQYLGIVWPEEGWQFVKVSVQDIREWQDHLRLSEKKAPSTLNHRLTMVSAFYEFLREVVTEHRLPIQVPNPAHRSFIKRPVTKPVDETEPLSIPLAQRLIRMPNGDRLVDYRDRAILAFYTYSGAREGTGCRLEVSDFRMDAVDPQIKIQEKGKENTKRAIGLNIVAAVAIHEYITVANLATGKLFRRQGSGNPHCKVLGQGGLSETAMYGILMKYLRQLPGAMYPVEVESKDKKGNAIKGQDGKPIKILKEKCRYSPHSLRATAATLLLENKTPITDVQELLGHAHVTTTQIYDHRRRKSSDSASHQLPI